MTYDAESTLPDLTPEEAVRVVFFALEIGRTELRERAVHRAVSCVLRRPQDHRTAERRLVNRINAVRRGGHEDRSSVLEALEDLIEP